MNFTIVFPSHESDDLSIGCNFTPCLVWKDGQRTFLNPHPDNPHYITGDFQRMLAEPSIAGRIADHSKMVVVVVHNTGHGSEESLKDLLGDIKETGFDVHVVHI